MVDLQNKVIDNNAGLLDPEKEGSVLDVFEYYLRKAVSEDRENSFRMDVGTGFLFFSGFEATTEAFADLLDSNALHQVQEDNWGTRAPIRVIMGPETSSRTKSILIALVTDQVSQYDDRSIAVLKGFIEEGLIDFRVITERNFHPKLYSFYLRSDVPDDIWSGSANFSRGGLQNNIELSVQMQTSNQDRELFREWFDELWARGDPDLDVLDVLENVQKSDYIYQPPAVFFAKLIRFLDRDYLLDSGGLTDGSPLLEFQNLTYTIVMERLQRYGGYILSNSVGTGKTYVGAQTAATYQRRNPNDEILVVAPSNVTEEWRDVFDEFDIENRTTFLSMGLLQKTPLEEAIDGDRVFDYRDYTDRYSLIIADEAHNYRNDSNRRNNLSDIIRQNESSDVLLTSATPINISPEDLFSLVDLFYRAGRVRQFEKAGLKSHYEKTRQRLKRLDHYNDLSSDLVKAIKRIENELSIKITWRIIQEEFEEDLRELAGGDVEYEDPEIYEEEYDYPTPYQRDVFDEIIPFLEELNYEPSKLWDGQGYQEFQNLIFRHKWRLYKRLESSLRAFYDSIDNLHKRFVLYEGAIRRDTALEEEDIDSLNVDINPREAATATDFERLNTVVSTCRGLDPDLQQQVHDNLQADIDLLERMLERITRVFGDPEAAPYPQDRKLERLKEIIKSNLGEDKPLLVFSQYSDTVDYIYNSISPEIDNLERIHGTLSKDKEEFVSRFNDGLFDVIITTDMLAEGVNIPRADVVVNFDLPYNPVTLIQRTGRALRITNPKKVEVHNFRPADSIDRELELYQKLDARLDTILDIVGLDFIVWMIDEKRVERLHEEEREEYLENLEEYNKSLASSDPYEFAPGESPPEETRTDQILRRAINEYDLTVNDVESLSPSIGRPIYTVIRDAGDFSDSEEYDVELPGKNPDHLGVLGETGDNRSVWTPLKRGVERGSKDTGLSTADKNTLDRIREARVEKYNRQKLVAGELGRAATKLRDNVDEVIDIVTDEKMTESLVHLRDRLEADAFTASQQTDLDDALSTITSEDYGWMENPDEEIKKSSAWKTISRLSEKGEPASAESTVKAVIKYENNG